MEPNPPDALVRRRAAARVRRRRRRLAQGAALGVAVLALAVILATQLGDDGGPPSPRVTHAATRVPVAVRRTGRTRAHHAVARPALAPVHNPLRGTAARAAVVPILMYHVVSAPPPGTPNPGLWMDPQLFARQMSALHRAGYQAVTLHTVFRAWRDGGALPRRAVVLTFDDGYASDSTHARPVLRALGWPGVLNLELHNVGPKGITTGSVRRLVADGWEIDSHTLTHPDLTTVDAARLRQELIGSRAAIRRRFGQPADYFCYPAGRFDDQVVAAVKAAGYQGATTELPGPARAAEPYALPRIRVTGGESPETLLGALRQ